MKHFRARISLSALSFLCIQFCAISPGSFCDHQGNLRSPHFLKESSLIRTEKAMTVRGLRHGNATGMERTDGGFGNSGGLHPTMYGMHANSVGKLYAALRDIQTKLEIPKVILVATEESPELNG